MISHRLEKSIRGNPSLFIYKRMLSSQCSTFYPTLRYEIIETKGLFDAFFGTLLLTKLCQKLMTDNGILKPLERIFPLHHDCLKKKKKRKRWQSVNDHTAVRTYDHYTARLAVQDANFWTTTSNENITRFTQASNYSYTQC